MTDNDNLNFLYYLKQALKVPFPKLKYKHISTKEIEKITIVFLHYHRKTLMAMMKFQ